MHPESKARNKSCSPHSPPKKTDSATHSPPHSCLLIANSFNTGATVFQNGCLIKINLDVSIFPQIGASSVLGSPENEKFCGTNIPSFITSIYNVLYVTFVKSSSAENRGFTAKYSSENLGRNMSLSLPLMLLSE